MLHTADWCLTFHVFNWASNDCVVKPHKIQLMLHRTGDWRHCEWFGRAVQAGRQLVPGWYSYQGKFFVWLMNTIPSLSLGCLPTKFKLAPAKLLEFWMFKFFFQPKPMKPVTAVPTMASSSHLDAVPQATPINRNRVVHKKVSGSSLLTPCPRQRPSTGVESSTRR